MAARPKWRKAPAELVERFESALAREPRAEQRAMFGYPAGFGNGNMATGLHPADWMVRPAEAGRAALLAAGEAKVCRKIGEEATEVITAALGGEGDRRVTEEVADLWFHTLVLLGARGISLREVLEELARRHAGRAPTDR